VTKYKIYMKFNSSLLINEILILSALRNPIPFDLADVETLRFVVSLHSYKSFRYSKPRGSFLHGMWIPDASSHCFWRLALVVEAVCLLATRARIPYLRLRS
jgi:hypothetical protein